MEMKESGVIKESNLPESKVALVYGQMVRQVPSNLPCWSYQSNWDNQSYWKGGKA
jgi:hypothetical protein